MQKRKKVRKKKRRKEQKICVKNLGRINLFFTYVKNEKQRSKK